MEIKQIQMDKIFPEENQPRKTFDEHLIKELAESIKELGLINPVIVKKDKDKYSIIAGERRFRAVKLLGYKKIDAVVYNDDRAMEVSIVENIQRKDLNPIEEAIALKLLMEKKGYTHKELSKIVGKSRPYITNKLRLLKLDDATKKLLIEEKITQSHARALVNKKQDERKKIADKILKGKLTVRQTENLKRENKEKITSEFDEIIEILEDKLDTKVSIEKKDTKTGIINIEFYTKEQLEDILEKMI